MMSEAGVVIQEHGGVATVRVSRAKACAHCKVRCVERNGTIIADNPVGAEVGDKVRLELNSRMVLSASLIAFGLPLLALLVGAILTGVITEKIGYQAHKHVLSGGVGIILFLLTFIPVKIYDRHLKKISACSVSIVEILERSPHNLPE